MKRLAAVVVTVLALAGCATTGQPGDPGVAAHWNGTVVTNAEVGDWNTGLAELGLVPDAGAALTFLMIRPTLDSFAAESGAVPTDAEIEAEAELWLAATGQTADQLTPEMVEVVRTVRTFAFFVNDEDFLTAVIDDWGSIDQTAVISPLYGDFSIDVLGLTFSEAHSLASATITVVPVGYMEYRAISAFDATAPASWVVSEAPVSAPSAAPAG